MWVAGWRVTNRCLPGSIRPRQPGHVGNASRMGAHRKQSLNAAQMFWCSRVASQPNFMDWRSISSMIFDRAIPSHYESAARKIISKSQSLANISFCKYTAGS